MSRRKFAQGILILPLILGGCSENNNQPTTTDLKPPSETGILKVATRNGSTTYYLDRHENPVGPEHALISAYAEQRGWRVEWTMLESTSEVLAALESGNTHLAAAGLTHLASRDERFARGPAHTEITEQLVCHRDARPMPRKPEDIPGTDIVVTAGSSYVETLNKLNEQHPGIGFQEDADRTTEVILSDVAEQDVGCTVADSNIVQVMRRHFPHLEVAMTLTEGRNLGWYLPKGSEDLGSDAHEWMNSVDGDEAIGLMENRYYSYIGDFDFVDLRALNRRIESRLPQFIDEFREADAKTGMPADLLAALAYQESHWDPKAKSPTGVGGIMMLTRRTADSLGVTNRLDPKTAINGGARYLALSDARELARKLDKNPDSWQEMTEVLPLKADKRYYPSTRYGYARGYEPVHYVQRIRNYRDVIRSAFE